MVADDETFCAFWRMNRMHSNSFTIALLNRDLAASLQHKIDQKTKPLGALGKLETLALQLGLIQNTLSPIVTAPHILICAGDHGAAKEGVSAYPQEVTWQMVENFLAGGAAINVLARQAGAELVVADAGVAHDFASDGNARVNLLDAKIAHGTANYLDGAAMTEEQCQLAVAHGAVAAKDIAARGCNVIGFGEMGIGNTASASLLMHCLTGVPLADCVGRGTGLNDVGLARKRELLMLALSKYNGPHDDAYAVLMRFGGFEIAMLTGAMLAAAQARMTLLIDGFIVTAALLVAHKIAPQILDYCIFAHRSDEAGHRNQLKFLGAEPLLDLGMRLGEGSGAAMALPILNAACAFMNEMASFESAGVSEKS
jgi:nicotinate-nucleotide--dimethylbenzimidazole phosphoribosyltransferase